MMWRGLLGLQHRILDFQRVVLFLKALFLFVDVVICPHGCTACGQHRDFKHLRL